jgi:hypothetical protein
VTLGNRNYANEHCHVLARFGQTILGLSTLFTANKSLRMLGGGVGGKMAKDSDSVASSCRYQLDGRR